MVIPFSRAAKRSAIVPAHKADDVPGPEDIRSFASGGGPDSKHIIDAESFARALTNYPRYLNDRSVVSSQPGVSFEPDGLHFRQVRFPDPVSLTSQRLEFAVHFFDCDFLQVFDACWAHLDGLSIRNCELRKAFKGAAVEVGGNVDFSYTHSSMQIDLSVARIQGDLVVVGARLDYAPDRPRSEISDVRHGTALFCGGIRVHSILMDEVTCFGRVFLDAAKLGGILKAGNAKLYRAQRDKAPGSERLDHIVLSATDTDIEGAVILGEETLIKLDKPQSFLACGQVSLSNSRIGGDLICSNGKFHSAFYKCEPALLDPYVFGERPLNRVVLAAMDFSRTEVEGGVWLDEGFQAFGSVLFDSVKVRGAFRGTDAEINVGLPQCEPAAEVEAKRHWLTTALSLERAQIGNTLTLTRGFKTFGSVDARNAVISGDVNCQGGMFHGCWKIRYDPHEQQPESLVLSGASIGGSVFLVGREEPDSQKPNPLTFHSFGQVRLRGTRIERNLHLGGGRLMRMPRPVEPPRKGPTGAETVGRERAGGTDDEQARIGWFHSTKVIGTTFLAEPDRPPVFFDGSVSFAGMQTDVWQDSFESWPQCRYGKFDSNCRATFELNGLVYNRLSGPTRGEERLLWLLHQPMSDLSGAPAKRSWIANWKRSPRADSVAPNGGSGFKTQPWEQCARVLYELGYHRDASLLFRLEQRLLRLKGKPTIPTRIFSFVLGTFVGHGYNVFYTVLWAAWLFVLGAIVADAGYRDGYIVPAPIEIQSRGASVAEGNGRRSGDISYHENKNGMPSNYPTFHPLLYALDIALPAGDLRQMRYWVAVDRRIGRHCEMSPFVGTINDAAGKAVATYIGSSADRVYDGAASGAKPFLIWLQDDVTDRAGPALRWLDREASTYRDRSDKSANIPQCPQSSTEVPLHASVVLAFFAAFVITTISTLWWLVAAATFNFLSVKSMRRLDAYRLYQNVLRRGRSQALIWIPPAIVLIVVFSFFFVTAIFLLNARLVADAIDWLDANFFKKWLSLSFVHVWSSTETLMGWLLITAVAIGLASAVFRRRD